VVGRVIVDTVNSAVPEVRTVGASDVEHSHHVLKKDVA
jgi:hypothetical protein